MASDVRDESRNKTALAATRKLVPWADGIAVPGWEYSMTNEAMSPLR